MKTRFAITGIIGLACTLVVSSTPRAAAQEVTANSASKHTAAPPRVDLSKLPAPVRATIEAETKNATLKRVSKETEKGQTQYEVETIVNGKSRDLLIDPSGKVLEVEQAIRVSDAPAAVQDSLKASGDVLKLERVQRDGKTTYEAQVRGKSGKRSSVTMDGQGKPLKG